MIPPAGCVQIPGQMQNSGCQGLEGQWELLFKWEQSFSFVRRKSAGDPLHSNANTLNTDEQHT